MTAASLTGAGAIADAPHAAAGPWQPLVPAAEVSARMPVPMSVTAFGRRWALVVLDGDIVAMHDVCPHRRVPLSAGTVSPGPAGGQVLECGYHGWSYDRSGSCARIPALGEDVVPRGMGSVEILSTVVAGGLVFGSDAMPPGEGPDVSDRVFLPSFAVAADADSVAAVLGAEPVVGGIHTGSDGAGVLAYAARATGDGTTEVFPLVPADVGAREAWADRAAHLAERFPPAPTEPASADPAPTDPAPTETER